MARAVRPIRADHEQAPDAQPLKGGGETVTVACKLPHGLELRLFDMEEAQEPVMGGGSRTVLRARPLPQIIKINGFAYELNKGPSLQTFGQYALTFGVDQDFFDRWLEENKDSDLVRNEMIFAHANPDHVKGMGVDRAKERSGLESVDPSIPLRVGAFKVEPAKA